MNDATLPAPALLAGNTVVVKPAEEAPLAALRAAQIMNQVLPPGVFNLVTGDGPSCGAPLVAHRDVKKVTFTGSVETGRMVYKAAAEKLIPVTLQLDGTGLAGTNWTKDLKTALNGAHRLEAGFVQVNQKRGVTSKLSYGGVKSSELGKEASLEARLEHFTHKKTIIVNMA